MSEGAAIMDSDGAIGSTPGDADWHVLPWLLGAAGAAAGALAYFLLDGSGAQVPWRVGLAAFTVFGTLALGFTLNQERPVQALAFALAVGVVLGGLAFHFVRSGEALAGPEYAFAAGILACALALPLFQGGFLHERFGVPYERVHFHVWSDAVAAAGAGAFALLSFLMLWLVDGLLGLVGIEFIEQLIEDGWFALAWLGGSFGTALGVLRNNLKVIGTLQSVALLVLALLAVPLAAALLVFLVALLASRGAALWEATDSATPVLLACAAGCWVLANAVIRDEDAAGSRNRVMRAAALVLALGTLPLAVFAAISMGMRIEQYGLAPERLWALVAIGVAVAFGVAYLVAVLRRRGGGWADRLRAANLRLAAGVCVLALLLALPVLDFGAISARNQLARLAAGEVDAEAFDYAALRWDFGEAGRRALAGLAEHGGMAGELAAAPLREEERTWPRFNPAERERVLQGLRFDGDNPRLERAVRAHLATNPWLCPEPGCTLVEAGAMRGGTHVVLVAGAAVNHLRVRGDGVVEAITLAESALLPSQPIRPAPSQPVAAPGTVEVRPFTGRQVYVDGRPVGEPFR